MVSGKQEIHPRFGPSKRILELAQHKISKTVWETTPCEWLIWGNQEPIRPISSSALRTTPSARIQYLSRHKRDISAREDHWRKGEEVSFFRKTLHPSSETSQYKNTLRLSTPKTRSRFLQEAGSLHTPHCDNNCPIWHIDPRVKSAVITPRLLQLSEPKQNHPDYQNNREIIITENSSCAASIISSASRTARISQRLVQLSLPKLRESNVCHQLGRLEEPIWTVSRAAKRAKGTARTEILAAPKQLHKDYIPPGKAEWSRKKSF